MEMVWKKNEDIEAEPYRNTPDEVLEEAWFEAGERLSEPPDPRKVAAERWEKELSLSSSF